MYKEEYIKTRKRYADLTSEVFKFGCDKKNALLEVAQQFNLLENKTIVMESEDDFDVLTDYLIFEKEINGQKLIDLFYDEAEDMDEESEEILESMINQRTSLYEIIDIEEHNHYLYLADLLNPGTEILQMMDINFSKTARAGMLIWERLLPFRDTYFSSGISFNFSSIHKFELLREISFMNFKKHKKISSAELEVAMFHKNKSIGMERKSINVFD